jgi:hypothetical protein
MRALSCVLGIFLLAAIPTLRAFGDDQTKPGAGNADAIALAK